MAGHSIDAAEIPGDKIFVGLFNNGVDRGVVCYVRKRSIYRSVLVQADEILTAHAIDGLKVARHKHFPVVLQREGIHTRIINTPESAQPFEKGRVKGSVEVEPGQICPGHTVDVAELTPNDDFSVVL